MSAKQNIMYRVEKFLPPECPKCRHVFQKESSDYTLLLGDIVEGKKVVRETVGYGIIVCSHCENFTARLPVEAWQVGDRKRATGLLNEGFVNLKKVISIGSHTQDFHEIHGSLGLAAHGVGPVTSRK
ncbi:MAG: hypothetical protein A3B74_04410 [Candidatus Kerfeldbacteria bacterium RIFCSPHIGHO2_02_FULL_42_14]|uniref:Uncharacterized protein n=1 Tax=Candidatus Kerfeldbacteria bacterium RIFCSPHIGHO2_02_FULL_42_14 TaxID=1798540 RepID=A0A1G2AQ27_9BACT|nr:MAG: hypothetical protein A3B74_04410 [Candidatus Kerfeldbacteria bacterium RIFCSPHIGHO2_02_FULL_42_14]OGY80821.1 MAG: hypothetical protein A3E60_01410 [Candidatus Kerfeldbacteria bacterium RIFCSPHIGHO2_12_FULL_42_13]OGY84993.1 MAG: hypothetical protein A3I91_00745 [Candidatus Kerfeldbacteria bacterium RIFCSPLOWO2_02_FULL_42_19]OGY86160.1 MAG: hypothetical protein A3G01_02280 [Candidatus Kerfeldbacteria bacterium RIFCSPLOWO2_12_FULL_43_9]